jgi:hypothetical protein
MNPIQRFGEYAAAFEKSFESDDWSHVEPYFADDAVYEIVDGGPIGGLFEGRDAVLGYFKKVLDAFDRRFDSRSLELLAGPEIRDGEVWMHWRGTYTLAGAPDLVIEGFETVRFEGDRIARLEDRYPEGAGESMAAYMSAHGDELPPIAGSA